MALVNVIGIVLCGCLLGGCGDDAACDDEKKLTDAIASEAEEVDEISAEGLCRLSQAELAARLENSPRWANKTDAERRSRAQEYLTNCAKLSHAKADCGD
jgi:hypothetical protein